jgi:hypothetical protein
MFHVTYPCVLLSSLLWFSADGYAIHIGFVIVCSCFVPITSFLFKCFTYLVEVFVCLNEWLCAIGPPGCLGLLAFMR